MIKYLLLASCLLLAGTCYAQDFQRIEVAGKILVENGDVEGVTVFNTSTNKGTIADFEGRFKIEVGLNDRMEISALQFEKFVIVVNQGILSQRKMTIYLVEQVNQLREVVVSPYDLSGNIIVDVNRVKTVNSPNGADNFDLEETPIDLTPDYKSNVENPYVLGAQSIQYGADILGIVGFLLKPLFNKNKQKGNQEYDPKSAATKGQNQFFDLRDMYSNDYIRDTYKIPENKINEFIVFAEDNGLDYDLLRTGREMEFIDFLTSQSNSFLILQGEKN